MEVIYPNIFQVNDPIVEGAYRTLDNYKIIYKDEADVDKRLCIIYFSSNEIYYPNTTTSFSHSILAKDKYEWINNKISFGYKHIFVRDIRKQWYLEGISSLVNSPRKVSDLLSLLTKDFIVYTVGSSAGGYAAILYGSILGAKRVYAFNAQMDLNVIVKNSNSYVDPLLFKHVLDEQICKYFKISDFLKPTIEYLYFQSAYSEMDIVQYNSCSNKSLLTRLQFSTSNHGFPFLRHDLAYVLGLSVEQLKLLSVKKIHPFVFSVSIHGFIKAVFLTVNAVKRRFVKKFFERMDSL